MLPRNIHRNLALIQAEVEARHAQKRLRVYLTWEEWFLSEAGGRISPLDFVMTEAKIRRALSKESLRPGVADGEQKKAAKKSVRRKSEAYVPS